MKDFLIISLIYTVCGGFSLAITLTLLLLYFFHNPKHAQKFYPGRILLNITILYLLLSLRFLLIGVMGDLGDPTTHRHSFGVLNYDCLFQGLFAFSIFLFLTGWNIAWLGDLGYATRNPRHLADDSSAYYMIFIYFAGTMIAFITFFSLERKLYGPSDWTYTCFINDGTYYYSIVNSLLAVYALLGLIFLIRGKSPRRMSKQFAMQDFIIIKKLYILLFLFTNVWGVVFQIFQIVELRMIFAIMISLQPGLFSLLWVIPYLRVRSKESKTVRTLRLGQFDQSMKKSFFDLAKEKLMESNSYITNEDMSDTGSDRLLKSTFRESPRRYARKHKIERQIMELLLAGMERAFLQFQRKRSSFYRSKNLRIREQLGQDGSLPGNKCLQILCCCCYRIIFGRADHMISQEELENERESMVFGHTAVLNKVDLISKEAIIRESAIEQVFDVPMNSKQTKLLQSGNMPMTVYFEMLAPRVFKNLRNMHEIYDQDIGLTFTTSGLRTKQLKIENQEFSTDVKITLRASHARMKIVTINEEDYETVRGMLPNFYAYFYMNPKSYLLPIYGCFTLQIGPSDLFGPQHFLLLPEVITSDCPISSITPECRVLTFEMKGSGLNRQTIKNARYLRDPLGITDQQVELMVDDDHHRAKNVHKFFKRIFKDRDFYESLGKLDVTNQQAQNVLSQIQEDLSFLVAHLFYDYNLKLKAIYKPCGKLILIRSLTSERTYDLQNQGRTLYVVDDGEEAIVIKEEGNDNKFYHICEKQSMHALHQFCETLQVVEEPVAAQPGPRVTHEGVEKVSINPSTQQSEYMQLYFDPSASKEEEQYQEEAKTEIVVKKDRVSRLGMSAGNLRYTGSHSVPIMNKTSFMNQTQSQQIINFQGKGNQHIHTPQHPEQSQKFNSLINPTFISSFTDIDKKTLFNLRSKCRLCKADFPKNHVIEVTYDDQDSSVIFGPNREVVEREPIQQIIIDPVYGLVKRQIHFAITQYMTPLSKRKEIDALSQGSPVRLMKNFSQSQVENIKNPERYSEHFMNMLESIFE